MDIIPIRNSDIIAEKIKKFYLNEELIKKMGEKAYNYVKNNFNINTYQEKILELIKDLED